MLSNNFWGEEFHARAVQLVRKLRHELVAAVEAEVVVAPAEALSWPAATPSPAQGGKGRTGRTAAAPRPAPRPAPQPPPCRARPPSPSSNAETGKRRNPFRRVLLPLPLAPSSAGTSIASPECSFPKRAGRASALRAGPGRGPLCRPRPVRQLERRALRCRRARGLLRAAPGSRLPKQAQSKALKIGVAMRCSPLALRSPCLRVPPKKSN